MLKKALVPISPKILEHPSDYVIGNNLDKSAFVQAPLSILLSETNDLRCLVLVSYILHPPFALVLFAPTS